MSRFLLTAFLVIGASSAVTIGPSDAPRMTTAGGTATDMAAAAPAPVPSRPLVVRGSTWYLRNSLSAGPATTTFSFGAAGDVPLMGDWDGNGTFTPGVVRGNTWYLRNSNTTGPADLTFAYGNASDAPVVGDWDGNGTFTPGVVRGNTWYLRNNNSPGKVHISYVFARASDVVMAGDWDGNGTSTPGVLRGSTRYLRSSNSSTATVVSYSYGAATDRHLVGDWDGNGTVTPGYIRGNVWHLRNSNSAGADSVAFGYGRAGDLALSTESAVIRDRGGRTLQAKFAGTEMTVLPTSAKVVALTFDAGANANGLAKILAALSAEGVPATFFLTGAWVRDNPSGTRQIGLLYPIGNHTDTHPHLPQLTDQQIRDQLRIAHDTIANGAKYDPHPLFRFPFADRNSHTLSVVNSQGYASINWTVDTLGWQGTSGGRSVSSVVSRVLANLKPGEIILMHVGSNPDDGSTLDADALPTVINELQARGYSFVTVMQYM